MVRWSGPLVVALAWLFLRLFADRWWPALPLLYGPRYVLGAFLLTPLLAHRSGALRQSVSALGAGALAFGLLLDFQVPWRSLVPTGHADGLPLRALTWNVQGGGDNLDQKLAWLLEQHADIITIVECASGMRAALGQIPGYTLRTSYSVCLLTPHEVVEWDNRDPSDFWARGGSGGITRGILRIAGRELIYGGVHLQTPRDALQDLASGAITYFPASARRSQMGRREESITARAWIDPPGEQRPVIVMGDFNLPVESAIYHEAWGDLTNVFGVGGFGVGWTKRTRLLGVRIDHILVGRGVGVGRVRLGPAMGSDHRPLIADLRLEPQ